MKIGSRGPNVWDQRHDESTLVSQQVPRLRVRIRLGSCGKRTCATLMGGADAARHASPVSKGASLDSPGRRWWFLEQAREDFCWQTLAVLNPRIELKMVWISQRHSWSKEER